MLCCTDVAYGTDRAVAAAVLFSEWDSVTPLRTLTVEVDQVLPYRSGHFFERELPCLVKLLESIKEPLDCVIVDGFVWLGPERPGLGHYLANELPVKTSVVGVAKNHFEGNSLAHPVCRGASQKALWVTAERMELSQAVKQVERMSGQFRIPTLLKLVDRLCREGLLPHPTQEQRE